MISTLRGARRGTATLLVVRHNSGGPKPFKKILAANRGEIATRILRAGSELELTTVAIYSHEAREPLDAFNASHDPRSPRLGMRWRDRAAVVCQKMTRMFSLLLCRADLTAVFAWLCV